MQSSDCVWLPDRVLLCSSARRKYYEARARGLSRAIWRTARSLKVACPFASRLVLIAVPRPGKVPLAGIPLVGIPLGRVPLAGVPNARKWNGLLVLKLASEDDVVFQLLVYFGSFVWEKCKMNKLGPVGPSRKEACGPAILKVAYIDPQGSISSPGVDKFCPPDGSRKGVDGTSGIPGSGFRQVGSRHPGGFSATPSRILAKNSKGRDKASSFIKSQFISRILEGSITCFQHQMSALRIAQPLKRESSGVAVQPSDSPNLVL